MKITFELCENGDIFIRALRQSSEEWYLLTKDEWLNFYHIGKRIGITFIQTDKKDNTQYTE